MCQDGHAYSFVMVVTKKCFVSHLKIDDNKSFFKHQLDLHFLNDIRVSSSLAA